MIPVGLSCNFDIPWLSSTVTHSSARENVGLIQFINNLAGPFFWLERGGKYG
jgi:hypothetical protein